MQYWIGGSINEAEREIDEVSYWDNPGFYYAFELPINRNNNPIWSQNNAERLWHRAQKKKANSEYRFMYQKTREEIRAFWQELTSLLQAFKTFKQQGQFISDELIDYAISSNHDGEKDILELHDAHREYQTYKLKLLRLARKVPKASIEQDRLTAEIKL